MEVKSVPLQSFGPGLEIIESVSVALLWCINSIYTRQALVLCVFIMFVCRAAGGQC